LKKRIKGCVEKVIPVPLLRTSNAQGSHGYIARIQQLEGTKKRCRVSRRQERI